MFEDGLDDGLSTGMAAGRRLRVQAAAAEDAGESGAGRGRDDQACGCDLQLSGDTGLDSNGSAGQLAVVVDADAHQWCGDATALCSRWLTMGVMFTLNHQVDQLPAQCGAAADAARVGHSILRKAFVATGFSPNLVPRGGCDQQRRSREQPVLLGSTVALFTGTSFSIATTAPLSSCTKSPSKSVPRTPWRCRASPLASVAARRVQRNMVNLVLQREREVARAVVDQREHNPAAGTRRRARSHSQRAR